ncbi:MAG: hypothetical protein H7335_09940 [Massilia sp.]|nr:hypothetical protein [Massilia sp.]
MKPAKSRLCLCCKEAFDADRRNARHQKYCSAPACRKASKAASQRVWIAKPENRNYHSGLEAVTRVRAWQDDHPEYRERQKDKRAAALQDHCNAQVLELKQESATAADRAEVSTPALQDFIHTQPHVFIGFIAHFFNLTLQDDISSTTRILQKLGEDIANGRLPDECVKTGDLFRTPAPGAGAVQLDRSAPGA